MINPVRYQRPPISLREKKPVFQTIFFVLSVGDSLKYTISIWSEKSVDKISMSQPLCASRVTAIVREKIRQMIFSDFEYFLERYILFHLRIQVDGQNLSSSVLCLESKLRRLYRDT